MNRAVRTLLLAAAMSLPAGAFGQALFSAPHGDGFRGLSPATVEATTTVRWSREIPLGVADGNFSFSDDGRFLFLKTCGQGQGLVMKLDSKDGSTVWATDPERIGFGANSRSGAVLDERAGRLYTTGSVGSVPSGMSIVACLSSRDGSVLWQRTSIEAGLGTTNLSNSNVLLSPDRKRVYVRSAGALSRVAALDAGTGEPFWLYTAPAKNTRAYVQHSTIGPAWTESLTGRTRMALVSNSVKGSVAVIEDAGDHAAPVWTRDAARTLQFHWWGNGVTSADGSRLFVTAFAEARNPIFTAFDTATGIVRGQAYTDKTGLSFYPNPCVGRDGTVYAPGFVNHPAARSGNGKAGGLAAFQPDGALKWTLAIPESQELNGWPTVTSNGVIYASDGVEPANTALYAIRDNGDSAQVLWSFKPPHKGAGPVSHTVGGDGTVYVTCEAGPGPTQTLYALAPAEARN